jgi:mono/diheme cytochrome c family protein
MRKFFLGFAVGILVLPVAAWVAAWLGMLPTEANAIPSRLEKAFAYLALDAAAARHAPHLGNPIAPTEDNLMVGMKLFKNDCAGCHGDPNTASDSDVDNTLYPRPPPFALHPPRKPDYQLFWIVRGGIRYSGMFAWAGQFGKDASGKDISDERIWTVVTFLTHLDSLPPAVDAEWHKKTTN